MIGHMLLQVVKKYSATKIFPATSFSVTFFPSWFVNEKDFLIVSHTSDPATDSAARLKKYADSMNVNTEKWIFLTGTKDSLYKQARYSYKIDDPHNNPLNSNEVDFLHSQFFSLVDKKGVVRRIYEGNVRNDVEKMIEQIEVLLKEK